MPKNDIKNMPKNDIKNANTCQKVLKKLTRAKNDIKNANKCQKSY